MQSANLISVMRLAPWLLLFSSAVLSSSETPNETPYDGIVAEEDLDADYQFSPPFEASRCCTDADPVDLLVVSTMDGKVQALDVANDGRLVWQSDLDGAALLGGNLGKMEPLSAEGDRFVLVPSLDGSLYMFSMEQRVLEPIPLSTDMLLHSVKIGKEAVAGGKSITTTGVDPVTGKIRYHCTSAHCEQDDNGQKPTSTLVFRRVSHNIRAVDALNGAEKWNLSVSEYDASIVRQQATVNDNTSTKKNVKFVISPPKGTITALDSCGRTLWTTSLGVHIARSWHLEDYSLSEVSLFDSNIHSISSYSKQDMALARPESLFYLGTIENDPFILCSEKLRKEMKRLSTQIDYVDHGRRVDANSGAIIKAGGETYQVAEGVLDEVLGRAFKQSISRLKERRRLRDINSPELIEQVDEMQIALPAPDNVNSGSLSINSCEVPDDHVLMIGEDNIRNAEPHGDSKGDQGWFILRPVSSTKSFDGILHPPSQCTAHFVKKSLHLEHDVNPLWRLLAIFLLFVTGVIGMFKFVKLRKRWRAAEVEDENENLKSEDWHTNKNFQSTSLPPQPAQLSEPAPVRQTASDDIAPAGMVSKNINDINGVRRKRNISSKSGTWSSGSENFESTFLRDYDPVKVLGRGGFGVVFEAINKLDQCHYAVKRIAVGNNESSIERVLREVRAMAMLDHSGIIRYCHTWIERPPEGWQKESDKAMLLRIQKKRKTIVEAFEPSVSAANEASSLGIVAPPSVSMQTDDESWADDPNDSDDEATTTSNDSSDEDESSMGKIVRFHPSEKSESIVFDKHSGRSKHLSNKSDVSEILQIDSKLALVTSNEELLPCRSTANNVYLYIQMQLCVDKTLYAWLLANSTRESRDPERMKKWMRQLVSAVDYIHDKGLIHRDIKPQNIFYFDASDSLKIGDLGLVSKGTNDQLNESEESKRRSSSSISSLHTDNLANRPYTSKVDVFSLGLIFTELNVPFTTLMERSKVLSGLQSGLQPDYLQNQPELDSFIEWLTKKDPEERPTCKEILVSQFLQIS
ncbi:pek-1 [Pristionchus pacificus]|uniref:PRKR-like endoplasmic reticulum kinase n=1 Tax=Pristionchus pacificus TaxID=54126 RepID=A0A2A6D284_PRIPA|nr:pek-1 [Pristionchus pacificus]|eukprot:PDM84544.1 pek-1 [Pristionchus pacificus]